MNIDGVTWIMKSGQKNVPSFHKPREAAIGVRLLYKYLKG